MMDFNWMWGKDPVDTSEPFSSDTSGYGQIQEMKDYYGQKKLEKDPSYMYQEYIKKLQSPEYIDEQTGIFERGLLNILNKSTPTTATYLAGAKGAGGLSYGSSMSIANKKVENQNTKNRDYAGQQTQQFKGGLLSDTMKLQGSAIGGYGGYRTAQDQLAQQQQQFNEQMDLAKNPWNQIINAGIGLGSLFWGGNSGGGNSYPDYGYGVQTGTNGVPYKSPNPNWQPAQMNLGG